MSFLEFQQKNTLFGKTNYGIFHYSLRVIDEPKMSEIRILNLCHKKSILVDIYRQWLLNSFVSWKNRRRCLADTLNDTWPVLFHISYREIPLRPYSYIFTADLTFASSECSQSSFYLFLILPFQGRHWPSLPSDVLWGSFVHRGIEGGIQIFQRRSSKLSYLFPPRRHSTPESLLAR